VSFVRVCARVQVHAGDGLRQAQAGCSLPPAPSARHEYSSMDVTLEVVPDMQAAIDHIHANGSGHTGEAGGVLSCW
jgi:gamma-glutamyl phosphate reductase